MRNFYFMLPKETIKELKKIYQDENGKGLSVSAALEMGNNLLNLFSALLKPFSEEEKKKFKKIMVKNEKQ